MKWGEMKLGEAKMSDRGYNNRYGAITDTAGFPLGTGMWAATSMFVDTAQSEPFKFKRQVKKAGPRKERCPNCDVVSMLPEKVDEITALKCPTCGAAFKMED